MSGFDEWVIEWLDPPKLRLFVNNRAECAVKNGEISTKNGWESINGDCFLLRGDDPRHLIPAIRFIGVGETAALDARSLHRGHRGNPGRRNGDPRGPRSWAIWSATSRPGRRWSLGFPLPRPGLQLRVLAAPFLAGAVADEVGIDDPELAGRPVAEAPGRLIQSRQEVRFLPEGGPLRMMVVQRKDRKEKAGPFPVLRAPPSAFPCPRTATVLRTCTAHASGRSS